MPFVHMQEKWIPWNKRKQVGQKAPLKPQKVWAIGVRLELAEHKRRLALFNLAIDSKLRGCDLLELRLSGVFAADDPGSLVDFLTLTNDVRVSRDNSTLRIEPVGIP